MLEREMDVVEVEESRTPLEERSFDLALGPLRAAAAATTEPVTVVASAMSDTDGSDEDDDAPYDPEDLAPDPEPTLQQAPDGAQSATDSSEGTTEPDEAPDQMPLDAPRRADNLLLYLDDDVELKDRD
jgi:hypothetical protein